MASQQNCRSEITYPDTRPLSTRMGDRTHTVRLVAGLALLLGTFALLTGGVTLVSPTVTLAVAVVDLVLGIVLLVSARRVATTSTPTEAR